MNALKFSGTFKFNHLDRPVRQIVDYTVQKEINKYHDQPNGLTTLIWEKDEDTYEVQVYNRTQLFGRYLRLETLPPLDKQIQQGLKQIGIQFGYTPNVSTNADKDPTWLKRLFGAKSIKP